MKEKRPLPPIVKLAILTAITIGLWIIFDVYRAFTAEPPPQVSAEILAPVNPTLDSQSLDRLQQRLYLNDAEIGDTIILNPDEAAGIVEVPSEEEGTEEVPIISPEPEESEPIATEEGEVSE